MHKFGLPLCRLYLQGFSSFAFAFWSWNFFSFDSSPANTHALPLLSHSVFVFLNHDYTSVKCRFLKYLTTALYYYCFIILLFLFARSASQAYPGGKIPDVSWNEHCDFLPFFQSPVFMPFFPLLNIFNSTLKNDNILTQMLEGTHRGFF